MSRIGCGFEWILRLDTITTKGSRRVTLNTVDIADVFEGRFLVPQIPDFIFGIVTDKAADAVYIESIECEFRILMDNGASHYLKNMTNVATSLMWDKRIRKFQLQEEEK